MKRKLAPSTVPFKLVFFGAWNIGWILVASVIGHVFNSLNYPSPLPRVIDYSFYAATQMVYALVQLWLIRRFTNIEPHRWLVWTFLGLVVGVLCESLWKDIAIDNNWSGNLQLLVVYRRLRYVLIFGIPTIFQYFSLPMHMSRRWLWVLAAVPGLALPAETPFIGYAAMLTYALQALAIERIDAHNRPVLHADDLRQEREAD